MSLLTSSANHVPRADVGARRIIGLYLQLAKARLSALVLLTTAVGFFMGAAGTGIDWLRLAATLVGTALAAAAANALNQLAEAQPDALMRRTRNRPIPSGALRVGHGAVFAALSAAVGVSVLAILVNAVSAALALLTILVYILIYTPLKRISTLNTLVGAVCGAIPPMIGWAAATGGLEAGAWILAAILFVWQIPHFFALAWLYREDYARGGFAMLPAIDRSGKLTARVVVLTSLALVPLAATATLFGLAGWLYAVVSIVLGTWFLSLGATLYVQRTAANARRLFLASIVYLPIVLCAMVLDRLPAPAGLGGPLAVASAADVVAPDSSRSVTMAGE